MSFGFKTVEDSLNDIINPFAIEEFLDPKIQFFPNGDIMINGAMAYRDQFCFEQPESPCVLYATSATTLGDGTVEVNFADEDGKSYICMYHFYPVEN